MSYYWRLATSLLVLATISCAAGTYGDYFGKVWETDIDGEPQVFQTIKNNLGSEYLITAVMNEYSFGKSGVVTAFKHDGTQAWNYHISGVPGGVGAGDKYVSIGTEGRGLVMLLDSEGNSIWKKSGGFKTNYAHNVFITDINGDGFSDVFSGMNFGMTGGQAQALGNDGSKIFVFGLGSRELPNIVKSGNVNQDSSYETIVGFSTTAPQTTDGQFQNMGTTLDAKASIRAYKDDGDMIWKYPTDKGVRDIELGDIDNDGLNEIVAAAGSKIIVLNGDGSLLWEREVAGTAKAVKIINVSGELKVATGSTRLYVVDSQGVDWSYATSNVRDIDAYDFDEDGCSEIVVGSNKLYVIDCNGALLWSEETGTIVDVEVSDINGLGHAEIAAASTKGIMVFKTDMYSKVRLADNYFSEAEEYFENREFSLVSVPAKNAYLMYKQLDDSKETKAREMELNAERLVNASILLNKSSTYFEQGLFEKANQAANEGIVYARAANDLRLLNPLNELREQSSLTPNAMGDLEKARKFLKDGLWENASKTAFSASQTYLDLEDTEKWNESLRIKATADKIINANQKYILALNQTSFGNLPKANEILGQAKINYTLTSNIEGMSRSMDLESVIKWLDFRERWIPRSRWMFLGMILLDVGVIAVCIVTIIQLKGGLPWVFELIDSTIYTVRTGGFSIFSSLSQVLEPKPREGKDSRHNSRKRARDGGPTLDSILDDYDH